MIHTTEPENQRNEESNEGRDRRAPDERVTRLRRRQEWRQWYDSGKSRQWSLGLGQSQDQEKSSHNTEATTTFVSACIFLTGCACMSVLSACFVTQITWNEPNKRTERLHRSTWKGFGFGMPPCFEKESVTHHHCISLIYQGYISESLIFFLSASYQPDMISG